MILRIGPYVCAEVSYGGFPFRLRTIPGIEFRTYNEPFMSTVSKWVKYIANELHKRQLLAPKGGPIILVQLENEYSMVSDNYGEDGEKYLQWVADLRNELDLGVPTFMCFGAAEGVLETINAFYAHRLIADQRARHRDQPLVWTECWSGWYNVWGAGKHSRPTEDLAYAVARFFADGGSAVNYYMWMGGTNFGRTPMYLQTTSYDYDAPLNEFYHETTKSKHLTRLHKILQDHFFPVLQQRRDTDADTSTNGVILWKDIAFLCNDSNVPRTHILLPGGQTYPHTIKPMSVHIVDVRDIKDMKLLFNTACIHPDDVVKQQKIKVDTKVITEWKRAAEPVPISKNADVISNSGDVGRPMKIEEKPCDQLTLTLDSSDYAFYTAQFKITEQLEREKVITMNFDARDAAHVYIDGCWAGESMKPLWEDRWPNKWNKYEKGTEPGNRHVIKTQVEKSDLFDLTIMTASLGLVKGDWQLPPKSSMLDEKKGLFSDVMIDGATRVSSWSCIGKLHGEVEGFKDRLGKELIQEVGCTVGYRNDNKHPAWYGCIIQIAKVSHSWVLDLSDVGKGLLYVNGVFLGRFWSIEAKRERNGFLKDSPIQQNYNGDTQKLYHVPAWVLKKKCNEESKRVEDREDEIEEEEGNDQQCDDAVKLHIVLFVEAGPGPSETDDVRLFEMAIEGQI